MYVWQKKVANLCTCRGHVVNVEMTYWNIAIYSSYIYDGISLCGAHVWVCNKFEISYIVSEIFEIMMKSEIFKIADFTDFIRYFRKWNEPVRNKRFDNNN